jgi:hypothetical protein
MVFSIADMKSTTKTSSHRLLKRGCNDEQHPGSDSTTHEPSSKTKPTHFLNPTRPSSWVTLLTFSFLSMSFNLASLYARHSPKSNPHFIPQIPYTNHPVIFHQDNNWVGTSPAVDKNWDQHINNALSGYITIPNPTAYNLRPGVEYGHHNFSEIFSISFYHQLHCLAMIRQAYYHPLNPHMHGHDSRSPPSETARRTAHLDHCFDYLRQRITCAADMTVEWAKEEVDGSRRQVDGWGIPHRECRDMEKVEAFMERWRID